MGGPAVIEDPGLAEDVLYFAARAVQDLRAIADDPEAPQARRDRCNATAAGLARSIVPDVIHDNLTADDLRAWSRMDPEGFEVVARNMSFRHLAQSLSTLDD